MEACKIFCNYKLLQLVSKAKIFNDSKHFVDMKLKMPPEVVENKFNSLLNKTKDQPSKDDIKKFLEENFEDGGTEFISWIPEDWKTKPKFTYDVYDIYLRNWVLEVNQRWKVLGRKLSEDVYKNNSLYSQIYVPNAFIVPGGRFAELYYWDSYWIIEGLLLSEMHDTAKQMIKNFLYLINEFGYIPNGSRKYYIGRSQPPFLTSMVDLYWKYTKDVTFLSECMSALEKEYSFWQKNRSITITMDDNIYTLFQYRVNSTDPRPESYYEDERLVKNMTKEERRRIFSGIKSAAESGWDFSSRWFLANGKHSTNMTDINTTSIAPVCLNSLMGLNARLLSEFFHILGNESKHNLYKAYADEVNITMSRIFWSDRDGVWFDYNVEKRELIPGFYPSNLMPLWTETYGKERTPAFIIEQAIAYLDRNNISSYPGGIPTSLLKTGQQWDLPNGWAPLQYFVVMGLHKARKYNPRAEKLAFSFAREWVLNVYKSYLNTKPHKMLEKYLVTEVGKSGSGGEYNTQEGFGWTNAVIMKFLSIYGHKIRTKEVFDPAPLIVGILLMVVSLVSVASYMHRVRVCQRFKWESEETLSRV
ncbi:Trehalase-like 1 [Homarus americanus]|uniref:Trehalase n=2 Tax=Homarus americanus TaxID=6706 RepID=A0A8J5JVU8_HOMAM|nr:Trehalase-like 1 [Homarus americanus]